MIQKVANTAQKGFPSWSCDAVFLAHFVFCSSEEKKTVKKCEPLRQCRASLTVVAAATTCELPSPGSQRLTVMRASLVLDIATATLAKQLSTFFAEHGIIWCGMSLWSFGINCPGCVPSHPLAHPSLLACRAKWELENTLMLCQQCSATAKTLVYAQHCFGHKSRTRCHKGCHEEN